MSGDPLAVAGLGQDEEVGLRLDDAHPDDRVALAGQADADDAGRVATHRPDLGLGEAGELALGRGDDHVVGARRDVDPGQLVVVGDRDRPDPGRADPLELLERRLLDDALAGRQDEVVPGSKSGSMIVASGSSPDSTWTPGRLMIGMPLA